MSKIFIITVILLVALFVYVGKAAADLNACIQPSREIYETLPWQYQTGKISESDFKDKKEILRGELDLCKAQVKEDYYLHEYFAEVFIYLNTGGKGVVL